MNFILPNGSRVENIEILSLSLVPVAGTYNIYPVQPPKRLDDTLPPPWVPPDSSIYSTDALYPDSIPIQVIHRGAFNGIPGVLIAVYPLLYNPVKESLYLVQSVTYRFTLESVPLSQRPQIMGERVFQLYKNSIKRSVYNYWEAESYYTPPALVPDEELLQRGDYEAVIVTPSEMALAYQPLAKWLVEKGMPTMIVTLDWIYAMYDGHWTYADYGGWSEEHIGDDAAKIKEFLYAAHWEHGLAFAILGGAPQFIYPQNYLPCRYSVVYSSGIPTDLYFQDFTGNWPNNPDYYEEIWIGRVPAWNYDQALSWVEKRLTYEKSPANRNLMDHSLWITQEQQPPDSIDFVAMMDTTKKFFPPYIRHHQVVSHPCNAGNHSLTDTSLSIGYGMLSTYGHGAPDNQRTAYPDLRQLLFSWPCYYNGIMPNLREPDNVDKYYIVYSIGCDNAWYDTSKACDGSWTGWTAGGPYPCIAEAFTTFYRLDVPPEHRPAINAVAFLGNTRAGIAGPSEALHRNFIVRLFQEDTLIGIAEAKSKYGLGWWYIIYGHNLFGSPEMPVWTENPKDLVVNHPDAIPVNIPVNFEVTVYEDPEGIMKIPVENALVTLYKEGLEVYQSQLTNAAGKAYFSLNVYSTGIMKVTVTKHNYIPYQGDVQVFEFDVDISTTHSAYSEGRKLVHQPNTEDLHLAYTYVDVAGGVNGPDDWSAYALSTDGGTSWIEKANVSRFTCNPSIGLTTPPYVGPCLAFRNSYEPYLIEQPAVIYFARYDAPNWTTVTIDSYPYGPGPFQPRVSPPAIRIDANNICHMVYSGILYAPGKAYVVYKRFDVFNPTTETVIIDSADVSEDWQPLSPSIGLQYGYPHIVYDFPPEAGEPYPEIWYKCLTQTGWTDPINISNSYNNPSVHPFIYLTNEKALVVWSEEEIAGNANSREIYKAERFLNQPPNTWTKWKEIETPNQASDWPVISANDRILIWCEHQFIDGKQNWEVLYHSDLYGDGNLSNTPYTQSLWPSCDWRQTLNSIYLYTAFTENYESEANPYIFGIKTEQKRLEYIPIPKYTIYAGVEAPSPYLIQRDGYIAYEDYPVDYDTSELIYKFTGLNPDLKYRLDITAYHEGEGEWREWVKVDNTAQHLVKYSSGIPVTVELPVPPASYMNDGEIIVRIHKISGDFAAIHKGDLYEFEKEGKGGGPQTIMTIPQNLVFGLKILPNIVKRTTQFKYTIPEKQRICLKLYDIVGRKVATITDGIVEPGIHSYIFDSSNLSQGVYFSILEGEKETKTQKILIVR